LAVATPVGIIHSKGANRGRRGGLNDTTLSEAFKLDVEVKVNIDKSEHYNGKKNVSTTGQLWGGHRDVDFYMGGGMFSVVDRCWMFGCPMSTWDLFPNMMLGKKSHVNVEYMPRYESTVRIGLALPDTRRGIISLHSTIKSNCHKI
jgi:hypothetical protein